MPVETKRIPLKVRLLVLFAAISTGTIFSLATHQKYDSFLKQHFWQIIFLPLIVLFLIIFIRNYYLQYKR